MLSQHHPGRLVQSGAGTGPQRYYVDSLSVAIGPPPPVPARAEQTNGEASRLFTRALTPGSEFTGNDRTRMAQLVAARTGMSQQEAEQRVDQVITQAKTAADQARKAAAKMAFWMAAALIAGAFAASIAAIEGGRERDN